MGVARERVGPRMLREARKEIAMALTVISVFSFAIGIASRLISFFCLRNQQRQIRQLHFSVVGK